MNVSMRVILYFFIFLSSAYAKDYFPKDFSREDPAVKSKFFKPLAYEAATPAAKSDRETFTSQEEMMLFLRSAVSANPHMKMEVIGRSQRGKDIPLVVFAKNGKADRSKITIWIQAGIHGDEPGGGEALLGLAALLSDGSYGSDFVEKANLIIVPRANPDGAKDFRKLTDSGKDINDDFISLELPETRALVAAFNRYKPHVVLDVHEYVALPDSFESLGKKGAIPYHDILMLSSSNPNSSSLLSDLADNLLIKNTSEALAVKGISSSWYYNEVLHGSDKKDITLVMAGSAGNIGRNYYALNNAVSVLIEGRGRKIGRENFSRRVGSLLLSVKSMIKSSVENRFQIIEAVENSRNNYTSITVLSAPTKRRNEYLFIDRAENALKKFPVIVKDYKNLNYTLKKTLPLSYIIANPSNKTETLLKNHGISYKVLDNSELFTTEKGTRSFSPGTIIISKEQPKIRIVSILLEPENPSSLVKNLDLTIYRHIK